MGSDSGSRRESAGGLRSILGRSILGSSIQRGSILERSSRSRGSRVLGAIVPLAAVALLAGACSSLLPGAPPGTPVVTSVSPAYGPVAGGGQVTIHGSGLSGATAVDFGSTPATGVKVISASEVVATAPASSSATQVNVRVTTANGTSAVSCLSASLTCADGYYYLKTSATWDINTPVNYQGTIPIPSLPLAKPLMQAASGSGGSSGSSGSSGSGSSGSGSTVQQSDALIVSATGGTLAVKGSMAVAEGAFGIPAAMIASGTVSASHIRVTLSGWQDKMEVPLPLGLPYGLDVYVTVTPKVVAQDPLGVVVNGTFGFDAGATGVVPQVGAMTLSCAGVPVTSLLGLSHCLTLSIQPPTVAGTSLSVVFSPLWLQVGPSFLNAGVGPSIGAASGFDAASAPYFEVCAGAQWGITAPGFSRTDTFIGPYSLVQSKTGDPSAQCPINNTSSGGLL